MDPPSQLRSAANERDEITIARREFEDETVIAIDFGPDVDATVDIVGDTAIVVAGDQQYEFEIPAEATDVTTNDGMLLIKETRNQP